MVRDNEEKKGGCCLCGCFWMLILWSAFFVSGWFVCNLEHHDWDYAATKKNSFERVQKHLKTLKDKLGNMGGWLGSDSGSGMKEQMVPAIPGVDNWSQQADEAAVKAGELLRQAHNAVGAERERLVRVARLELKNALDNYIKAEQVDTGNQVLTEKIARVSKMLEQLGGIGND